MAIESERTFKIDRQADIRLYTRGRPYEPIEQLYLSPLSSPNELRLRRIGGDALLATLKQGHGEVREETEVAITEPAWKVLSSQALARLEKTRYYLNDERNVTLDTFPSEPKLPYGLLEIEQEPNASTEAWLFDMERLKRITNLKEVTEAEGESSRHLALPINASDRQAEPTQTTEDALRAIRHLYKPDGKPTIVTIGGPSASGKSTLLEALKEDYGQDLTILSTDDYYIGKTRMRRVMPTGQEDNFDHPKAINTLRLERDLKELLKGSTVHTPIYDMLTSEPIAETREQRPAPLIAVEGIIANLPRIRNFGRLSIALTTPLHERLARRIERDRTRKGHTPEETMSAFLNQVEPSYLTYHAHHDRDAKMQIST